MNAVTDELRQRQPRVYDPAYLSFVRTQPCCVCYKAAPSEAAHIRMACEEIGKPYTGKGQKPDDRWAVPLCGPVPGVRKGCHAVQHSMLERKFWEAHDVNPFEKAAELYAIGGGKTTTKRPERSAKIRSNPNRKLPNRPMGKGRGFPKRPAKKGFL